MPKTKSTKTPKPKATKKVPDRLTVRLSRVIDEARALFGEDGAEKMRERFASDAALAAAAAGLRRDHAYVAQYEDPRKELRLLAWRRRGIIRTRNAIVNMCSEKRAKRDDPRRGVKEGDPIPSPLPDDVRFFYLDGADRLNEDANAADQFSSLAGVNRAIEIELNKDPVYTEFLSHVAGLGPATAGILLGLIDFTVCDTPSKLLRFCGQATHPSPDGRRHLESRVHKESGKPLTYCSDVRAALWNWTNSAARTSRFGRAWSSKYLDAWFAYKQRMAHSPRLIDGANLIAFTPEEAATAAAALATGEKARKVGSKMLLGGVEVRSSKAFIQKTGAHKMADALLYDLYLVGRAHAGLPVSVTWHEKARGFTHGAHVTVDPLAPPRLVSFEAALAMVGDVGQRSPLFLFSDADEEAAALAAE